MRAKLSVNDWILVCAFLDGQLTGKDLEKVQKRIESDPGFKTAVDEISCTQCLLRALPARRAPRNFTLSKEKVKAPIRHLWLQPAMSYVSIASAALLVFTFVGSFLFRGPSSAEPMLAAAPEMAVEGLERTADTSAAPMIINWNPMLGMGGGGGDSGSAEIYKGGDGIGGAGGPGWITEGPQAVPESSVTEVPPSALMAPQPTTVPPSAESSSTGSDLSTIILGLPDKDAAAKVAEPAITVEQPLRSPLKTRTLLMILSGGITILAGIAAILLRRR